MEFSNGDAVAPLAVVGDAPIEDGKAKRGTEVTFLPSSATFTMVEFDYATIEHRLRELAFLNSGVRIVLTDSRHAEQKRDELYYEGGLEAFVRYLDRAKTPLIAAPILINGQRDQISVEVALWWNDSYHENVLAFTNNIPQRDDGTHLAGFRAALTRQVTGYSERSGLTKREKVDLTGDDCREGLTCVVSVKAPDRNSPRRRRTSSFPRKCVRRSRMSSMNCSTNGWRSIRRRPRPSSPRSARRRPRARRRARRAS